MKKQMADKAHQYQIEKAKKRILKEHQATVTVPFGTTSKRDLSVDIKQNPGPGHYEDADLPL